MNFLFEQNKENVVFKFIDYIINNSIYEMDKSKLISEILSGAHLVLEYNKIVKGGIFRSSFTRKIFFNKEKTLSKLNVKIKNSKNENEMLYLQTIKFFISNDKNIDMYKRHSSHYLLKQLEYNQYGITTIIGNKEIHLLFGLTDNNLFFVN